MKVLNFGSKLKEVANGILKVTSTISIWANVKVALGGRGGPFSFLKFKKLWFNLYFGGSEYVKKDDVNITTLHTNLNSSTRVW